jgi:hypothetical protein
VIVLLVVVDVTWKRTSKIIYQFRSLTLLLFHSLSHSLVTAGKYADPTNPPEKPLTEKGLEDISVGIIFNMLYGVLVGINLLSAVTHFGFYASNPLVKKALSTGCPYSTSLVHARDPKGILEAVTFLAALVAALALSTVWGLAILSTYGAFAN